MLLFLSLYSLVLQSKGKSLLMNGVRTKDEMIPSILRKNRIIEFLGGKQEWIGQVLKATKLTRLAKHKKQSEQTFAIKQKVMSYRWLSYRL